MQNYSNVFAETLAEFVSPIVPADQGDNGKGQVTARAAYKISSSMNPNVGHIGKNPGQTQYPDPAVDGLRGIAVDALIDKSDGTGADYLTDVDLGNGTREIRVAYTPYAPPPAGSDPTANFVQPSTQYRDLPGPLTLKADSGGGDGGGTDPVPVPPPADYSEVLEALDELGGTLATMQVQQQSDTDAILQRDDANTERSMQQIRDLVEDVEETLVEVAVILLLLKRDDPAAAAASSSVDNLRARIAARRQARQQNRDARRI